MGKKIWITIVLLLIAIAVIAATIDEFEDVSSTITPTTRVAVQDPANPTRTEAATVQAVVDKGLENTTFVTAHSDLTGLDADDHSQYHTDTRGDARYYTKTQADAAYEPNDPKLQEHLPKTDNPHVVTQAQVGIADNQLIPVGGTTGQALTKASNANNDVEWASSIGGGGPGGIDTELQYNNSGVFGGMANFISDGDNLLPLNGAKVRVSTSDTGHKWCFQAYDVDDIVWRDVLCFENANTPKMELQSDTEFTGLQSYKINASADGMADNNFNGISVIGRAAGEILVQWDLVCMKNTANPWYKAEANVTGSFPALGISVAGAAIAGQVEVLTSGVVRNEAWTGLTPSGAVYLSTTAGGITQTAPSAAGNAVQIVGFALSDSEILFDFSRPYSEVE